MALTGLQFQVNPEYYAALTLESLIVAAVQPPPPAAGAGTLLQPPLPQPVLDLVQNQGSPLQSLQGQPQTQQMQTLQKFGQGAMQSRFSTPWQRWFMLLYGFVTQGAPAAAAGASYIEVIAPSVDETDIGWYGNGTINGSTDPVSFTPTLTGTSRFPMQVIVIAGGSGYTSAPSVSITDVNGHSNGAAATAFVSGGALTAVTVTNSGYGLTPPLTTMLTGGGGSGAAAQANIGRQWGAGDYIIWNDPVITGNAYNYEIDKIASIGSGTFQLARHAAGAAPGFAQFGSKLAAHSSANFYRLIAKSWLFPFDATLGPQLVKLLWDNMTVAAVTINQTGPGANPINVNLAPAPYLPGTTNPNPRLMPPAPGLRTMNGAAYTTLGFSGTLLPTGTSAARVSAQAWESVRTVYAKIAIAPTGPTAFGGDANAAVVLWVCYISPPNSSGVQTVGLLDCLVIDTGKLTSYPDGNAATPNVPDGRQMPYHALGQWIRTLPLTDWPPNFLPVLTGALNATGGLQLGTAPNLPNPPSGTASVQFQPDGQIDFIIGQVGTIQPGANLIITVQT